MQAAISLAKTGILAKSKCQKEMQLMQQTEISLEPSTEANHTERRRPRMDPSGIKPLVSHISQAHHHAFSALCSCSISISVAKLHLQQSKDKFSAESLQPLDHPRVGHDSTQVWAHSLLHTHIDILSKQLDPSPNNLKG